MKNFRSITTIFNLGSIKLKSVVALSYSFTYPINNDKVRFRIKFKSLIYLYFTGPTNGFDTCTLIFSCKLLLIMPILISNAEIIFSFQFPATIFAAHITNSKCFGNSLKSYMFRFFDTARMAYRHYRWIALLSIWTILSI